MRDITLIPDKYFEKKRRNLKIFRNTIFLLVCIAAAALLAVSPYIIIAGLEAEKAAAVSKVNTLAEVYTTGRQYDYINTQFKERETLAAQLSTGGIDMPGLLGSIEASAPAGLYLAGINVSEGSDKSVTVSINGSAAGRYDISTFIANLETRGTFAKVTLDAASVKEGVIQGQAGYAFVISMKMPGREAKP